MATFTHLSLEDAQRIAAAHALPPVETVVPVAAGTVNSNYFLVTSRGRFFVRLYEQQDVDGVAYEWSLLSHLGAEAVPVPARIEGPMPGALRVDGRPVAVFAEVKGEDLCQARVDASRLLQVGHALGNAHRAGLSFGTLREGRFRLEDVARLLEKAEQAPRPELSAPIQRLHALHADVEAALAGPFAKLPRGVIHGDLFRDNVLWQGTDIVALLDWESASHGLLAYDVAVTLLAWCCGDRLDFTLGRALVDGYRKERELSPLEWQGLWWTMRLACLRFATTRMTDIYLKGTYPEGYKRYQRFLERLDAVEALTAEELAETLGR
jgi:homoserine kinase type II